MEEDGLLCSPQDGLLKNWRWGKQVKDQAHLKQRIRDIPGLLKQGLHLRKKSVETPNITEDPSPALCKHKGCSESLACAGRGLRNAFLSHGPYPVKDRIQFARILRRSYVGVELVQWLVDQSELVPGRTAAACVWQVVMELGVLLSVDHRVRFEDSHTYYQFSFEECQAQDCGFQDEDVWLSGVRLLLQLVPSSQLQAGGTTEPEDKVPEWEELPSRSLQMEALERLTSTVQNELVLALAKKAQRTRAGEGGSGPVEKAASATESPAESTGGVCALRGKDDTSRLEVARGLAQDGCPFLQKQNPKVPDQRSEGHGDEAARVVQSGRHRDVLLLQQVLSKQLPPPSLGRGSRQEVDKRYVVVSGTPEKILEHLLSDLQLDGQQEATQCKEAETLLDDFLLTYLVFMSTSDLCQALLGHYCAKRYRGKEAGCRKEGGKEALHRKRKVLHLVSQWSSLYRDFLREEEHVKLFMKTLYRYVLDDLYEYPALEKDFKEFQKLLCMSRRHTVDEYSPHRKNKALFHQLSLKENLLQSRGTQREKEVFCHVYVTADSYLSIKTYTAVEAQELLSITAGRMECTEDGLLLAAETCAGERLILQPHDSVYSESRSIQGRLLICRKDLSQIMNPFTDNADLHQRPVRLLGMNTWDVAVSLTNFDWSLFTSVREQEPIYYTISRQGSSGRTAALEMLLQRCNEVQLWVMTEVLLCTNPGKRVQLLKKFIKIAAHCKAQRNLNSFFAIIMGLNTAAVSRLSLTWEKVPCKFRKLFSELEMLTDPSLNHKVYRDIFKKMKPPKIPFMPLLLKDITFIHEGNKTFLDNLVNFEKLHMIADAVRLIRHCQMDHTGNEVSPKDNAETRSYINYLHIIDNQQTLFDLSHRLEPRM
ncbi:rap guanine nucleotide exchange factor 5-like [Paramormyrops kingsleyae]|uniref:rap guanine nucleotide exchange factor 5-like n=1 Tax=Paramormyrops kingsleyae TaxID=1676925 RepID=UPI000CD5F40E|nr:rap guanine nucleotide exchange factor 5-like [Paramormyrops kingsleyae]